MNEECSNRSAGKDWAGSWRSLAALWGIPGAAMLGATLLEPGLRATVWTTALFWMGSACIANARRCGRTHCRFTGPFYLLMAVLVLGYAIGALSIGDQAWAILGATTIIGTIVLWWGSERIWGPFWPHR